MDAGHVVALAFAGAAAGLASGLLGVGGGIVMTPVLHYLLGRPWSEAVALSLLAIALQSPMGVLGHARRRAVAWRLSTLMAGAALAGVALGDWLLPRTPVSVLRAAFGVVLALTAFRLWRGDPHPRAGGGRASVAVAAGAAAGVVGRLFGVGGGIVTVPALAMSGVPVKTAVGSSLVPVFVGAAAASGANLARGLAWHEGAIMAAAALAFTLFGVRLAHALDEHRLRRVVAVSLAGVALYVMATSGMDR